MKIPPVKHLAKKQRVQALLLIAGFFGAACVVIIVMNVRGITIDAPAQEENTVVQEEEVRDPFTGVLLTSPAEETRVACVMVENSADAWPLSGIEDAFFVIEAPVEGNIPRFMACYTEGVEVEKIGPVRSARPYYVQWAGGLGAMYAHVGGSPESLQLLATTKDVVDLNEFWNGASFWRDSTRFAPHNSYTSTALLWSAATRLGVEAGRSPGWEYGEKGVWVSEEHCEDVHASWGSASTYRVTWDCDAETKSYVRKQGGSVAQSSDKDQYHAQNVVVMETDIAIIDAIGRRRIRTTGTGNAIVCSLGVCQDAVWEKEGADKPLRFYASYPHEPIIFSPGTTWVEVVGG